MTCIRYDLLIGTSEIRTFQSTNNSELLLPILRQFVDNLQLSVNKQNENLQEVFGN